MPENDKDQIVFSTKEDAQKVLDYLLELIKRYEYCTVSDLKELVGLETSWADIKKGWAVLKGVEIKKIEGGFILDLPIPGNIVFT